MHTIENPSLQHYQWRHELRSNDVIWKQFDLENRSKNTWKFVSHNQLFIIFGIVARLCLQMLILKMPI